MTNTYVVVNTNYKYNEKAHDDMLQEGKAAAYYSPWKDKIRRIREGDKVFLYQSGTGIVAAGIGTGTVDTKDYKGEPDEEFFMVLDSFQRLKTPLSPGEIRKIAGKNIVFLQTLFLLPDEAGKKIWKQIKGRQRNESV
ncbi:MAG: hypothetical protein EA344_03870 [Alkalicoccus sp.]|nr:MAG: hypothetical protein EA344_03870 [Alkalicoccus sp.]